MQHHLEFWKCFLLFSSNATQSQFHISKYLSYIKKKKKKKKRTQNLEVFNFFISNQNERILFSPKLYRITRKVKQNPYMVVFSRHISSFYAI